MELAVRTPAVDGIVLAAGRRSSPLGDLCPCTVQHPACVLSLVGLPCIIGRMTCGAVSLCLAILTCAAQYSREQPMPAPAIFGRDDGLLTQQACRQQRRWPSH